MRNWSPIIEEREREREEDRNIGKQSRGMYIWRRGWGLGENERKLERKYGVEIFEKIMSKNISNLEENIILQSQKIQQALN